MEIVRHAGLEIFITENRYEKGGHYLSVVEPGLWFGVLVSGNMQTYEPTFGAQEWHGAQAIQFGQPEPNTIEHFLCAETCLRNIFIRISPESLHHYGDEFARKILRDNQRFILDETTQKRVELLALNMLHCRKIGIARKLSLCASAHEIISENFTFTQNHYDRIQQPIYADHLIKRFTYADIERTQRAKHILLSDLRHAPKLDELAREVGMNSKKLTQIFVALYGETPHNCLKEHRLDAGLRALGAGQAHISVADIARDVGYQPAHFTTAFRHRFGRPPSAYLATK